MALKLPSLSLIREQLNHELELQLRHFDALDAKAGIVLGFAAALVALAGGNATSLGLAGGVTAGLSALVALGAFVPRKYPVVNTRSLRDKYVHAELQFTELHLLDTSVAMNEEAANLLKRKARWLIAAIALLAGAALLLTLEVILN